MTTSTARDDRRPIGRSTTQGRTTLNTHRIAAVAMMALAVEVVLGYTVLQGTPALGTATVALVPLLATWSLLNERRWAPVVAVLSALTVLGMRSVTLSFDLVRPGDLAPFALAVATLVTIGVGLAATLVAMMPAPQTWLAIPGGLAAGAVMGAGLVLGLAQSDDTAGLSEADVAALPTIQMVDFKFEPGQLRVAEGQPVAFTFTNDTGSTHSFAIDAFDLDVRVPSGRTRVVVVEAGPGAYPFHCSVGSHADDGMKGRLVVDGEDGHAHEH